MDPMALVVSHGYPERATKNPRVMARIRLLRLWKQEDMKDIGLLGRWDMRWWLVKIELPS